MPRYVVLVRGVNVGGHNKLPMSEFRDLLIALGLTKVATYLQSGNAVVTAAQRSPSQLAIRISEALREEAKLDVKVLVVAAKRLRQILDENPMADLDDDPTHLHVAFLEGKPPASRVKLLNPEKFAPDRFEVVKDVVYLHYPSGAGRSKLDPGKAFAPLGVWATARNWRTVQQLSEMAGKD